MDAAVYRARRPAETPLYALLDSLYETAKGAWEDLFERGFSRIRCPGCQCVMRVVAFITEGRVIRRILDHLGASATGASHGRAPPLAAAPLPGSL